MILLCQSGCDSISDSPRYAVACYPSAVVVSNAGWAVQTRDMIGLRNRDRALDWDAELRGDRRVQVNARFLGLE